MTQKIELSRGLKYALMRLTKYSQSTIDRYLAGEAKAKNYKIESALKQIQDAIEMYDGDEWYLIRPSMPTGYTELIKAKTGRCKTVIIDTVNRKRPKPDPIVAIAAIKLYNKTVRISKKVLSNEKK